ncbi:MAG TPA: hypothetical protein VJ814_00430 [Gaiellaceae bacterium]|nr:hypothetical protein [Gaiellaceae bacterium]
MKTRLTAALALAALVTVTALTVAPAAPAAPPTASITNQISGTATNGGTLTGTLSNLRFVNLGGGQGLALQGVLNGTFTSVTGVVTNIVNKTVTLPVQGGNSNGTCTILDLTLGPLHLDLLGLVVDLNQVHLTITGQTGNGQLLGNLLCGLANALNGNGGGLAGLLNNLLGL